jgi:hypothetical protein
MTLGVDIVSRCFNAYGYIKTNRLSLAMIWFTSFQASRVWCRSVRSNSIEDWLDFTRLLHPRVPNQQNTFRNSVNRKLLPGSGKTNLKTIYIDGSWTLRLHCSFSPAYQLVWRSTLGTCELTTCYTGPLQLTGIKSPFDDRRFIMIHILFMIHALARSARPILPGRSITFQGRTLLSPRLMTHRFSWRKKLAWSLVLSWRSYLVLPAGVAAHHFSLVMCGPGLAWNPRLWPAKISGRACRHFFWRCNKGKNYITAANWGQDHVLIILR